MPLTSAQLQTLKTAIAAETGTIPAGFPWSGGFVGVAVKDVPNNDDGNNAIAGYYSQVASPDYFVWATSVSRSTVYHSITAAGTVFDWGTFKAQSVTEQNAWVQMFMGDNAPFHNLSFRNGVFAIFSGSASQNAQRAHIFNCGRRLAKRIEKLFAVAVTLAGGISPVANNGNVLTDTLGGTTNPAVMQYEGSVSIQDINTARNLP